MSLNFWDQALGFGFMVTFLLVLGAFLPLVISIWRTWLEHEEQQD